MTTHQLYTPLNTLKSFAEDVWIVDGPEIAMDYLAFKLPFPTRMTVVRLPSGGLWVHSPVGDDPALFDAVAALGPVEHLIAPNSIHYWWVPDWHARFPGATVHAVPGLAAKAKRPLPPHRVLGDLAPPEWGGVIEQVMISGSILTEADFLNSPSRTLILTDLIENFEPERVRSALLRGVMRIAGAADPNGSMPIDMRLSYWRQRRGLRAAVERMIGWNPERIVLAHGRCYTRDGAGELRRAFRWLL